MRYVDSKNKTKHNVNEEVWKCKNCGAEYNKLEIALYFMKDSSFNKHLTDRHCRDCGIRIKLTQGSKGGDINE